jgi:hypothetical protein
MKLSQTVLVLCVIAFIAACSHPPASESDARAALEQKIQKKMSGLIRLISFKKTNGTYVLGLYSLQYTAEVEFLDDCIWNSEEFSARRGQKSELDVVMWENKKKGQREEIHGSLMFAKTDKGWSSEH